MRRYFAGLIAVLALGCLGAAAPVLAQTTTTPASTTDTSLSGYTSTSTGSTTIETPTTVPTSTKEVAPSSSTVTAQPTAAAPTQLAFTGANALWLIIIGGVLASGAVALLIVDRRSRRFHR